MVFVKHWNGQMVVDHILRHYGREPVNYHHYVTNYPDVHAAGVRIFGTWRGVIEACGIDYSEVRKYRRWSKEKVIEEIKKLNEKGKPLYSNYAQRNYKPLYMAAVKRFKGWREALTHAGINYNKVRLRRSMTPEEIKKEILSLYDAGVSLAYTNMRANYQYLMAAGMKKLGNGSWDAARKACGITTNYRLERQRRKSDKKKTPSVASSSVMKKAKTKLKRKSKLGTGVLRKKSYARIGRRQLRMRGSATNEFSDDEKQKNRENSNRDEG